MGIFSRYIVDTVDAVYEVMTSASAEKLFAASNTRYRTI